MLDLLQFVAYFPYIELIINSLLFDKCNFYLGGLPDDVAATYLHHVNALVSEAREKNDIVPSPYARLPPLTFSFGRGLQGDAMERWVHGDEEGARQAFFRRAKVCSESVKGLKDS